MVPYQSNVNGLLGLIVPIRKGGELDDPNNYRGITLNSCLSKLFTYNTEHEIE